MLLTRPQRLMGRQSRYAASVGGTAYPWNIRGHVTMAGILKWFPTFAVQVLPAVWYSATATPLPPLAARPVLQVSHRAVAALRRSRGPGGGCDAERRRATLGIDIHVFAAASAWPLLIIYCFHIGWSYICETAVCRGDGAAAERGSGGAAERRSCGSPSSRPYGYATRMPRPCLASR